jgi:hypothetical protein
MKTILLSLLSLITMTSCSTYIDYQYKGSQKVECQDIVVIKETHTHWVDTDGNWECILVDKIEIVHTQYYIIEHWVPKRYWKFGKK